MSARVPGRAGEFAVATLLVAMLAASTPWTRAANPLLPAVKRAAHPLDEPRALAMQLSATHDTQRMFAPLRWASYFTWHSHGRLQSFIDSRVDFFPDDVWNDYLRISAGGQQALKLLDDYLIEVVICDDQLPQLSETLRRDPRWQHFYKGQRATAFRRSCNAMF